MSDFCLECWNKLNNINLSPNDVKISKDQSLCEGCSKYKNVIIKMNKAALKKLTKLKSMSNKRPIRCG